VRFGGRPDRGARRAIKTLGRQKTAAKGCRGNACSEDPRDLAGSHLSQQGLQSAHDASGVRLGPRALRRLVLKRHETGSKLNRISEGNAKE